MASASRTLLLCPSSAALSYNRAGVPALLPVLFYCRYRRAVLPVRCHLCDLSRQWFRRGSCSARPASRPPPITARSQLGRFVGHLAGILVVIVGMLPVPANESDCNAGAHSLGARALSLGNRGPMAEWLRRGLQILARRFDSGSGLQFPADGTCCCSRPPPAIRAHGYGPL